MAGGGFDIDSYLAGFWTLWAIAGWRTARGQWRSSARLPRGVRMGRALGAFFAWPAWLWRVFG